MILNYGAEKTFAHSLTLDDFGNCCIRAINEADGIEYYISIQTILGKTFVLKFGPVCPDINELINDCYDLSYKKITYNEKKIAKELNLFINDPKKKITNAELIEREEMFEAMLTKDKFVPTE